MKKQDQLSFPHPVVGNSDDAVGNFIPTLTRQNDRTHLHLEITDLDTGNTSLNEAIREKKAAYVVRVECVATVYRESFLTQQNSLRIEIELNRLYRKVDVDVGVVALHDFGEYRPSLPHSDYGDAVFGVEAGDVLAVGDGWTFSLLPAWDPLRAPVASLMRIQRGSEEAGPLVVALDEERIIIRVPSKDYDRYLTRKSDAAPVLHAVIVLPVLAQAIERMHEPEFAGNLWAGRIAQLLERRSIDYSDPLRAAQELLEYPVTRALTRLDKLREDP